MIITVMLAYTPVIELFLLLQLKNKLTVVVNCMKLSINIYEDQNTEATKLLRI